MPEFRHVRSPKDGLMIALPHKNDVTRLCRNLGYIVPAPIINHYKWPNNPPPFKTQKVTAALLTMNHHAYVLSEMGTGKTRASLYAIDYMFQEGSIDKVLVVAPLSTLSPVWDREIFEYFNHLSVGVVHGTRSKRAAVLKEKHQIYVTNHDGVGVMLPELLKMQFDVVVIDEVGVFRNKSTDRWKNMFTLIEKVPYVWGMTGSPTPNEPPDAWGIAKLLTPGRATDHKNAFIRKTMTQVSQFRWIPKPDANDHVFEMLQPAVRYTRNDCVELPPVVYQDMKLTPSKQVADTYKKMMTALKVAFREGEITAANEGVLFMKLLQIASGWVYTRDRGVVSLDNTERVNAVLDIIEQSVGKVIVFADFTHTAQKLHGILLKNKIDCALVTGAVQKRFRDEIFNTFQNSASPRVLVAHPKCMAHGLTLTSANTVVWFTPCTSLETYEQACARITRPGQTQKSMIIHLTGSPIESKLYARLKSKAKLQGALLDMFNDE